MLQKFTHKRMDLILLIILKIIVNLNQRCRCIKISVSFNDWRTFYIRNFLKSLAISNRGVGILKSLKNVANIFLKIYMYPIVGHNSTRSVVGENTISQNVEKIIGKHRWIRYVVTLKRILLFFNNVYFKNNI